jgi:hypothetical protein
MGPAKQRTADLLGIAGPSCPQEDAGPFGEQLVAAGIGRFHERDRLLQEIRGDIW